MRAFAIGAFIGCVAAVGACAPGGAGGDDGQLSEVSIALTSVPATVTCIRVQATVGGAAQAPALLTVAANASSATLNLGRLPAGAATFTGAAYALACTDATVIAGTASPAWVSDTATATLTLGMPATIGLTFHQNNNVTVSANFNKSVASIAVGQRATYAVMADGTVKAWGITGAGVGTLNLPTDFPGATGVAEVTVSDSFACLRTTAGAVQCWGILPGAASSTPTPTAVTLPAAATAISAGRAHICAVVKVSTTNNPIYCWGANNAGQLGNGTVTTSNTPVPVLLPSGISGVALAAGGDVTCATTTDAAVMCWGYGGYGQIGNGAVANQTRPVRTLGPGAFKSLAVGGSNACVVMEGGSVQCWGVDAGDGVDIQRNFPVVVSSVNDAVTVAAGNGHDCIVRASGAVVCWGGDVLGQIGQLSGVGSFAPVAVPGLPTSAVGVAAHQGNHTCALLSDGAVWCWGNNDGGQLGDGTITPRFVPVAAKIN